MFRFENPLYLYLLLVIPVIILIHYITNYRRKRRLEKYGDIELLKSLMPDVSTFRREVKTWLTLIAIFFVIIAIARPQYGVKTETRKRKGIEAIIAIDISNSMLAEDVKPSRLDKAKMLVSSIVDKMTDDKIGLIVYAGEAFTQLPITSDYVSAKMFLETISPSLITTQGTDIRRAIELANRSFTPNKNVSKAIFVITDGEDNEGGVLEAVQEATGKGIKIYVMGIGSPQGAPIPIPGQNQYITDQNGNVVVSKLNEEMCKEIAKNGEGAYIYVDNSTTAQRELSGYVDKLAKKDIEDIVYSEFDEQFQAAALLALILLVIEAIILESKNPYFKRFKIFTK